MASPNVSVQADSVKTAGKNELSRWWLWVLPFLVLASWAVWICLLADKQSTIERPKIGETLFLMFLASLVASLLVSIETLRAACLGTLAAPSLAGIMLAASSVLWGLKHPNAEFGLGPINIVLGAVIALPNALLLVWFILAFHRIGLRGISPWKFGAGFLFSGILFYSFVLQPSGW